MMKVYPDLGGEKKRKIKRRFVTPVLLLGAVSSPLHLAHSKENLAQGILNKLHVPKSSRAMSPIT